MESKVEVSENGKPPVQRQLNEHNAGSSSAKEGASDHIGFKAAGEVLKSAARFNKKRKGRKIYSRYKLFERRYTDLQSQSILIPESKKIDYVLVHSNEKSEDETDPTKKKLLLKREKMRCEFENALRDEGFSIQSNDIDNETYKKLHCPFKRLCAEAENVRLEMPLKDCQVPDDESGYLRGLTEKFNSYFETDNEVDYVSAPFIMDKIDLYQGYEDPTNFFRSGLRSLLTHHILINKNMRKNDGTIKETAEKSDIQETAKEKQEKRDKKLLQKRGLPYLLMKGYYKDAFILHDQSEGGKNKKKGKNEDAGSQITQHGDECNDVVVDNQSSRIHLPNNNGTSAEADVEADERRPNYDPDPRKTMDETWTKFWKYQPLWKIRNYFGEKIALYFAWSGMLITTLWIPTLFGLIIFFYGLALSIERNLDQETTLTTTVTPTNTSDPDALEEIKETLLNLLDVIKESFDNAVTPYFAMIICIWGTLFLELWKRSSARLSYEWDVEDFESKEPDRPEFYGLDVKTNPISQEQDYWHYPLIRQFLKFACSASSMLLLVFCVLASVAAVIVYRVIISVNYCPQMSAVECLITTTIISSLLNAVSILILGRFYDWIAVKLTNWENHRTQTNYEDALIIKLFAFSFANSYASCFYIAFFRGKFDIFGVFGLGATYIDDCSGTCMSQLSFQVLVLMVIRPFPRLFLDILLPWLRALWKKLRRLTCCRNQVDDAKKKSKQEPHRDRENTHSFLIEESQKPELGQFTINEFTEKVIQYGFLMLFAASFPLAPLLALLVSYIDIRVDAKRMLWMYRRPVAFIAQNIGMWYGILQFVNLCGVISNGFLIAFTSSWGSQYSTTDKLWIVIGFEHIVFALKFIVAYLIPDVPSDVKLAIRRERYQVAKKLQADKENKFINYSDLVPAKRYIRQSANYDHFSEDEGEGDQMDAALVPREAIYNECRSRPLSAQSSGLVSVSGVDPQGSSLLQQPYTPQPTRSPRKTDSTVTQRKRKAKKGNLFDPVQSNIVHAPAGYVRPPHRNS